MRGLTVYERFDCIGEIFKLARNIINVYLYQTLFYVNVNFGGELNHHVHLSLSFPTNIITISQFLIAELLGWWLNHVKICRCHVSVSTNRY